MKIIIHYKNGFELPVECEEFQIETDGFNDKLRWAFPYMDEAIGKPMTVISANDDGVIYCEFDTSIAQDDGRWAFLSEWLEPYKERD